MINARGQGRLRGETGRMRRSGNRHRHGCHASDRHNNVRFY
jgi:hypothetical protein